MSNMLWDDEHHEQCLICIIIANISVLSIKILGSKWSNSVENFFILILYMCIKKFASQENLYYFHVKLGYFSFYFDFNSKGLLLYVGLYLYSSLYTFLINHRCYVGCMVYSCILEQHCQQPCVQSLASMDWSLPSTVSDQWSFLSMIDKIIA